MEKFTKLGLILCLLMFPFMLSAAPNAEASTLVYSNTGPYVNKIVYKDIVGEDQRVLAIQNNEIDIIYGPVNPATLATLEEDPNIAIDRTPKNGFGQLTINCDKYPLNITAFRRALAYAINKTEIVANLWAGEAQPHDTHVPSLNPWCYESYLSETYYAAQPAIGNNLLDAAGFLDIDADGFREAPNGSDFSVEIEMPAAGVSPIAYECGVHAAEALGALGIDAAATPSDFNEYMSRVNLHGDFDIVFYGVSFAGLEPTYLETDYGSDYYMADYYNPANFQNATFDSWIPQFLYSTTYEDVLEAVYEMQHILWFQQPRIVLYDNYNLGAYRTDVYEGHVSSVVDNIANSWTNLKVHKKTGDPFGGTFRIGISSLPESFNHMLAASAYAQNVLSNVENTLMRPGPDGALVPWLAESYLIQTHSDNPAVPTGHTRLTFNLLANATWSDGIPLNASDVAFTLNYYKDSIAYGNPTNVKLIGMTMAYASSTYQLVVEMDTESFWHLKTVAYNTILPYHVFSDNGIGPEDWSTWNPIIGPDPFVTSGPFYVTEFVDNEFVELTYDPSFFFSERIPSTSDEMEYPEGSTGNTVDWDFTHAYPLYYQVYRDEVLIDTEPWDGSAIEYNVDGLSLGTYNFTIVAFYGAGDYATHTVMVSVYDGTPPEITDVQDTTLYQGRPESVVVWWGDDLHPASYLIIVNESLAKFGMWNSSSEPITLSMSEYAVGTYLVTVYVSDVGLNMAFDSLWVTIAPYVPPTTTSTTTTTATTTTTTATTTTTTIIDPILLGIIGLGGGVLILIIAIVVIKKRP